MRRSRLLSHPIQQDAESIFKAALRRVDPAAMVRDALSVEEGLNIADGSARQGASSTKTLLVRTMIEEARYDLGCFDRVMVAGMGKAGASMALGTEEALGNLITGGIVAVKEGYLERLNRVRLMEASHPLPDERSQAAATALLDLGSSLGTQLSERDLVIVLISGGGSALLCAPAEGISLEDKTVTTRLLLSSGATIQEMNCVRKHLSAVKGGRLAAALSPATVLGLILSDVVGDDLDAIASGPTVPDSTTWEDALRVVESRGIQDLLPPPVTELLRRGALGFIPETPKPNDPIFARTRNILVGTNRLALMASEARARELGYATLVLTSRLTGEAREAALCFFGIGQDIAASGFPLARPACLIVGGETTVSLKGKGKGGRNQEMALAFLSAMAKAPKDAHDLVFLSAGTDGSDGPTDAAGAFASALLLEKARDAGLDPEIYLADNDSYSFFDRIDGLFRTGPTNTNVCDVQILLVP